MTRWEKKAEGYGWIPADPSEDKDVRQKILNEIALVMRTDATALLARDQGDTMRAALMNELAAKIKDLSPRFQSAAMENYRKGWVEAMKHVANLLNTAIKEAVPEAVTTWMRMNAVDGKEPLIIQGSAVLADPAADPEVQARVLRAAERYFDEREESAELHIEGEELGAAMSWVLVLASSVLLGEVTLKVEEARTDATGT